MPLDPALQQLLADRQARAPRPQWELPIAEVRQAFRDLWTPAMTGASPPMRRVENFAIAADTASLAARAYVPDTQQPLRLLVYFHGGGYVKGGLDECDAFCRSLAVSTGHLVLSIDYRLAPEHPFPAAHDDAFAATRWASAHARGLGVADDALVIGGEYDTLRDEAHAYTERLHAAGVAARYVCAPGMVHGFLQMGGLVPRARTAALEDIARALK